MQNEIIERIEEQAVEQTCNGVSFVGFGKFAAGFGLGMLGAFGIKKLADFISEKKQRKVEQTEDFETILEDSE